MEADVAFIIIIIIISSIPPQSVGCKLEGWHCCRGSGASDRLSDGSDDLFRLVYDLHQHQQPAPGQCQDIPRSVHIIIIIVMTVMMN